MPDQHIAGPDSYTHKDLNLEPSACRAVALPLSYECIVAEATGVNKIPAEESNPDHLITKQKL